MDEQRIGRVSEEHIFNFTNWAEKNSWKIIVKKNENLNLSSKLLQRYDIPFEYEVFLKNI